MSSPISDGDRDHDALAASSVVPLPSSASHERLADSTNEIMLDDAFGDFSQLVRVGRISGERLRQRDWQLTEHARACKALKMARSCVQAAQSQKEELKTMLTFLSHSNLTTSPCARQLHGPALMILKMHAAASPTVKGKDRARAFRTQNTCACQLRSFAEMLQRHAVSNLILHASSMSWPEVRQQQLPPEIPANTELAAHAVVSMFDGQWDTTSQRLRALTTKRGKTPRGQTFQHVMMQSGKILNARFAITSPDSVPPLVQSEPYIVGGIIMEGTATDEVLAAVIPSMPVHIERQRQMLDIACNCDALILHWCLDRAMTNYTSSRYIWTCISKLQAKNIYPSMEPCGAHSTALVKSKSTHGKTSAITLNSLARLTRDGSTMQGLSDAIAVSIETAGITVSRSARPQWHSDWAGDVVRLLFGEDLHRMHRVKKSGGSVPGPYLTAVQDMLACLNVTIGAGGQVCINGWIHFCHVNAHEGARLHLPIGAACCRHHGDAVARVVECVHNFMVGQSWPQAADNRWTHTMKLRKRWLLATLANGIGMAALKEVQYHRGAHLSLEAELARRVATDANDFSSRNKLKLMRICKVLCNERVTYETAIYVMGESLIDDILYQMLGNGDNQSRCTIFDLCDPSTSKLIVAQSELVRLLEHWSSSAPRWHCLHLLGASFNDNALRMAARAFLMKLDAGLMDFFVIRMAMPPYSLLTMYMQGSLDAGFIDNKISTFYALPYECLSLMCRRLREQNPSRDMLRTRAKPVLMTWSKHGTCSMDFTERSHNQMRLDLKSSGPAKNSGASQDRVFCRQIAAAHKERGGLEYGTAKPPLVAIDSVQGVGSSASSNADIKSVPRHPGNAYMYFQNRKLRAAKALVPDRPMAKEEIRAVMDAAQQEWSVISSDPAQLHQWRCANHASKAKRITSATINETVNRQRTAAFKGVWGSSTDPKYLVDPYAMAEFVGDKGQQPEEYMHTQSQIRIVRQPVTARYGDGTGIVGIEQVHGCWCSKKNVCRAHQLSPDMAAALDHLTRRLSEWADSLPVEASNLAEGLLCLHDCADYPHTEEIARDTIVICHDNRLSPKVQMYIRCHLDGDSSKMLYFNMPALPVVVHGMVGTSRLSGKHPALMSQTSDELCHELLLRSKTWAIRPLVWQPPPASESLLAHLVTEVLADFEVPRTAQHKKLWSKLLADVGGNPLNSGHAAAANCASGSVHDLPPLPATDAHQVDETVDLLHQTLYEDEVTDAEDGPPLAIVSDHVSDADPSESEHEAHVDPSVSAPTAEDFADQSELDASGRVTCKLSPYDCYGSMRIGRITTWPATVPMSERSIGCVCYLHGNCRSPAKRVVSVSQHQLLVWLFRAHVEIGCTSERQAVLRKMHKDEAVRMFAAPVS